MPLYNMLALCWRAVLHIVEEFGSATESLKCKEALIVCNYVVIFPVLR